MSKQESKMEMQAMKEAYKKVETMNTRVMQLASLTETDRMANYNH